MTVATPGSQTCLIERVICEPQGSCPGGNLFMKQSCKLLSTTTTICGCVPLGQSHNSMHCKGSGVRASSSRPEKKRGGVLSDGSMEQNALE